MPVQQAVFEPLLPLPDITADGAWSPHIDVRELPDEYIVLADLPGVEPEAVHVTTETNTVTIEGARRDRLRTGGVPYRLERPTGKLRRSVLLPGPYDPTKMQTQIRDGVLEIRLPKENGAEAAPSNSQPLREATTAGGSPVRAERPRRGPGRRANDKSSRRQRTHGLRSLPCRAEDPALTPKERCGCEPD